MSFLGYRPTPEGVWSSVGKGLNHALEGLAQKKAGQVKFNQNQQLLHSLGIHPNVAKGLAGKEDKDIFEFLKNIPELEVGYGNDQGGYVDQNQGYNQQTNQPNMAGLNPQQEQNGFSPNQPNLPQQQIYGQAPNVSQMGQEQQLQPTQQQQQPQGKSLKTKGAGTTVNLRNIGQEQQIKETQKQAFQKIEQGDVARKILPILDEYEEILNQGSISGGAKYSVSKKFGIEGSTTSDDTQVLAKLSENMIPPTRTDAELKSYQARVPNPTQSVGAQRRNLKSYRKRLQQEDKEGRATQHIVRENGGFAPIGFQDILSSKLGMQQERQVVSQAPEDTDFLGSFTDIKQAKLQDGDIVEASNGDKYKFSQGMLKKVE